MTHFRGLRVHTRAAGLRGGMWGKNPSKQWWGQGAELEWRGSVGWDGLGCGGAGVRDKEQTGRGLHRQLEGIRVSDRDLSDAAVAAAD